MQTISVDVCGRRKGRCPVCVNQYRCCVRQNRIGTAKAQKVQKLWREKSVNPIARLNQGRKILHDWLGAGGVPVPIDNAQIRANTCVDCKYNYKGSWLWNISTSLAIAAQTELKETMKIRIEQESKLGVCEVCGCKLKLKIHVPFQHIYRHTSDEQFAKYPDWCWQKQELKTVTK